MSAAAAVILHRSKRPQIDYRGNTLAISSDYVTDGVEKIDINLWGFNDANITNNIATIDGSIDDMALMYQPCVPVNSIAEVYFKVLSVSGDCELINANGVQIKDIANIGEYRFAFTQASNATDTIYFRARNGGILTVEASTISVKKVIQEPNRRYLADSGGSPRKPALLTYGEGLRGNGLGQKVVVDLKSPIEDIGFMFIESELHDTGSDMIIAQESSSRMYMYSDGRVGLAETPNIYTGVTFNIGDVSSRLLQWNSGKWEFYVDGIFVSSGIYSGIVFNSSVSILGGGYYGDQYCADATVKNVQFGKFNLTPAQIQLQYNFPELFVYPKKELQADGSYKWFPQSEYLNQDELDSFVALIPLNGKGAFARNMIGYSESVNQVSTNVADWLAPRLSSSLTQVGEYVRSTAISTATHGASHDISTNLDIGDIVLITTKILRGTELGEIRLRLSDVETLASGDITSTLVGDVEYTGVYKITASSTYIGTIVTGSSEGTYHDVNILVKKLTNTNEIQNWTEAMDVDNLDTGSQLCFYDVDPLDVICGSNFKSIAMNGVAVPALAVPMTDTELNGAEGKWVIEFGIKREYINSYISLLHSLNSNTGLKLEVNRGATSDIKLELYDGTAYASVRSAVEFENPFHIIFENDGSNLTMIVDEAVGTPVAHSFVPSGLSFADSIQASPIGKLKDFKIWYGDNYYKYNREKSIAKGLIAKESML